MLLALTMIVMPLLMAWFLIAQVVKQHGPAAASSPKGSAAAKAGEDPSA